MNVHGTFAITGEEGSGKSLISISKVYEYLINGRPVISNFDIYLENLMPWFSRASYIRVPDFPSAADLWKCGSATDDGDESKFGLVLLDEIAVACNAREWKDSGRKELIDYFRQTRKHGFDKFFLSQGINSIDAQIRNDLIKFVVICRRTDSFRIPLIGGLFQFLGFKGVLPQLHIATVKAGKDRDAVVVDRWYSYGRKFYGAYDTVQKFTPDNQLLKPKNSFRLTPTPYGLIKVYDNFVRHYQEVQGIYSVLSAWHLKGRYLTWLQRNDWLIKLSFWFIFSTGLLAMVPHFFTGFQSVKQKHLDSVVLEQVPESIQSVTGVLRNGQYYFVTLDTGAIFATNQVKEIDGVTYYFINNQWMTFKHVKKADSSSSFSVSDFF